MNSSDELLAVRAAELYYDEGRTQDEIGAALRSFVKSISLIFDSS